jgi:myo-inositol-1(or 4)-monophosphatase
MPQKKAQQEFTLAMQAAMSAGALMRQARESSTFTLGYKDLDLVTSTDIAAEKCIVELIRNTFPTDLFLTEEGHSEWNADTLQAPRLWIIDPIDGTTNFASGQLHCAVSIAFAINGTIQLGVVYAPFLNELYCAQIGHGAYLNERPIQVGKCAELEKALVATGFPYRREKSLPTTMRQLQNVLSNCRDLRRLGSAAIDTCWVACGRLDAYYEDVKPWDIAAAGLIAREAGAKTGCYIDAEQSSDLNGSGFLVTNPTLYMAVSAILQ